MEDFHKYLINEFIYASILIILGILDYLIFRLLLYFGFPIIALYSFILIYVIGSFSFYLYIFIKSKKIFNLLINLIMNIIFLIYMFGISYSLPSYGHDSMLINNTPKNLTKTEGVYFSIVTITSLGYGDIVPNGYFRLFAVSEVILGLLYFGFFISLISNLIYDKRK